MTTIIHFAHNPGVSEKAQCCCTRCQLTGLNSGGLEHVLLLLMWLCSQLEAQPLSLSMQASVWPGLPYNMAAGPKGKLPKKESRAEAVLPFMTKPGCHLASLLSYLPYTTSQGNHKVLLRLKGRRHRLLIEGRDGKALEGHVGERNIAVAIFGI